MQTFSLLCGSGGGSTWFSVEEALCDGATVVECRRLELVLTVGVVAEFLRAWVNKLAFLTVPVSVRSACL